MVVVPCGERKQVPWNPVRFGIVVGNFNRNRPVGVHRVLQIFGRLVFCPENLACMGIRVRLRVSMEGFSVGSVSGLFSSIAPFKKRACLDWFVHHYNTFWIFTVVNRNQYYSEVIRVRTTGIIVTTNHFPVVSLNSHSSKKKE